MKIKCVLDEGKNKLEQNNIQDASIQSKILMKYVIKKSRKFFNYKWK